MEQAHREVNKYGINTISELLRVKMIQSEESDVK